MTTTTQSPDTDEAPKKLELPGVLDVRNLPDDHFANLWDSIYLDNDVKARLLSQAILSFTLRSVISRASIPLHGIILMAGAPGTGKTSMARGLASKVAEVFSIRSSRATGIAAQLRDFLFMEIEPHSLTAAAGGHTQKAVSDLLGKTIAEQAANRPLIVLIDEVEGLATDRAGLNMDVNPEDIRRATDAVLAQLDQLADRFPKLLFLATTNHIKAVDAAFFTRADLVITLDLPGPEACKRIITETLNALAVPYPAVKNIVQSKDLGVIVKAVVGLDGRRIRKVVAAACAIERQTTLDPNLLTATDLLKAAESAKREAMISGTLGEIRKD